MKQKSNGSPDAKTSKSNATVTHGTNIEGKLPEVEKRPRLASVSPEKIDMQNKNCSITSSNKENTQVKLPHIPIADKIGSNKNTNTSQSEQSLVKDNKDKSLTPQHNKDEVSFTQKLSVLPQPLIQTNDKGTTNISKHKLNDTEISDNKNGFIIESHNKNEVSSKNNKVVPRIMQITSTSSATRKPSITRIKKDIIKKILPNKLKIKPSIPPIDKGTTQTSKVNETEFADNKDKSKIPSDPKNEVLSEIKQSGAPQPTIPTIDKDTTKTSKLNNSDIADNKDKSNIPSDPKNEVSSATKQSGVLQPQITTIDNNTTKTSNLNNTEIADNKDKSNIPSDPKNEVLSATKQSGAAQPPITTIDNNTTKTSELNNTEIADNKVKSNIPSDTKNEVSSEIKQPGAPQPPITTIDKDTPKTSKVNKTEITDNKDKSNIPSDHKNEVLSATKQSGVLQPQITTIYNNTTKTSKLNKTEIADNQDKSNIASDPKNEVSSARNPSGATNSSIPTIEKEKYSQIKDKIKQYAGAKPPSLRNTGVNCYLNSAIQGISSCKQFLSDIRNLESKNGDLKNLQTFKYLIEQLSHGEDSSLEISRNSIFRDWNKPGQQDSYELLAYVINQVYNELRTHKENNGLIEKRNLDQWLKVPLPMRMIMRYEIKCDCGMVAYSPLQSDLAFHVTITERKQNLQDLFDNYFGIDPIEDYECDRRECHGRKATRIVKLLRPLPSTICIHLQRTAWNSRQQSMTKIGGKIAFETILNIKKEFSQTDETASVNKPIGDIKYSLKSVIVHHGEVSFGHYICYKLFRGDWYYTSDSNVSKVSWNVVRDCEAYILFYESE